ncbi:MAG TPA: hypothetical protein VF666_10150 [Pyrinomonadaceae bacterium]|jgi:hypothetical protein
MSMLETEDVRRWFQLLPHASVEVAGFEGSIEIETAATNIAEVRVTRTANNRADFDRHQLIIEATPTRLVVRARYEERRASDLLLRGKVRSEVKLVIPRQVLLSVSGIVGRVVIGEVGGSVRLSGINGNVRVGQVAGNFKISGINGGVAVALASLDMRGARISGINGEVELGVADTLNADIKVKGISGHINTTLSRVSLHGKPHQMQARIGSGGAMISLSGINGSMRLVPAA